MPIRQHLCRWHVNQPRSVVRREVLRVPLGRLRNISKHCQKQGNSPSQNLLSLSAAFVFSKSWIGLQQRDPRRIAITIEMRRQCSSCGSRRLRHPNVLSCSENAAIGLTCPTYSTPAECNISNCFEKVLQMPVTPTLLCGGSGTRLWPLSRKSYPKQFSSLIGQNTLFQASA